jgi:thiamine-phosphate pyrophosphorylase
VRGGARLIQVRAKHLASGPFLTLCERTVALVRPFGGFVIVNDRADLAAMAAASGVHVGQEDLSPADARAVVGIDAVIGLSTHSVDQIVASTREPISYLAVGPVFGTASKDTGYNPVGLELVRAAAGHAAGRPVVAIGGITLDTAPSVIAAGATSVAVIGDLCAAEDPEQRAAAYVRTLTRFQQ